jgi:predicted GH43/DUF377 family glycosyl hydrolase
MEWIKKGLIFCPDGQNWWSTRYAMYPTPIYLPELNCIRVYYGTIDSEFYGRTSFIDLNADDPKQIHSNSNEVVLDLGIRGTFDDCGATPASILKIEGEYYFFYSGFCRSHKSPYQIFSGLAISKDAQTFQKFSKVPVLDRTDLEYFDRAGQSVIFDEGIYKSWYVSGVAWETLNTSLYSNKDMPVHTIRYATSKDCINWIAEPEPSINFLNEEEFGFGRPWVYKDGNIYKMWYSIRNRNLPYKIGYAESLNGIDWIRKDSQVGIEVSEHGWDSEMICYGAVINVKGRTFMFYNGNNHGDTGFGYAEFL